MSDQPEEQDRPPTRRIAANSPDDFEPVTPNDGKDLPFVANLFWIGVAGDVAVANKRGVGVVFPAVPAGFWLCRAKRVMATGTTATGIVACR
jgi:hypothetical protein